MARARSEWLGQGAPPRWPNGLRENKPGLGVMRIAVLGAGAWGTGLAISLSSHSNASSSHQVILWTRNASHLAELDAQRANKRYFPAFPLPESLRLTSSLFTAI